MNKYFSTIRNKTISYGSTGGNVRALGRAHRRGDPPRPIFGFSMRNEGAPPIAAAVAAAICWTGPKSPNQLASTSNLSTKDNQGYILKMPLGPWMAKAQSVEKKAQTPKRTVEKPNGTDDASFHWRSAISFDAPSTATLMRKVLKGLAVDFVRKKSERSYSQLYAVLPFPRVAYVFRFNISAPAPLVIDIYETHPATYGPLAFMELPAVNDQNIELARKVLRALVRELPRPPWKFTAGQRVQHGLMNPDILRARSHWRELGIAD